LPVTTAIGLMRRANPGVTCHRSAWRRSPRRPVIMLISPGVSDRSYRIATDSVVIGVARKLVSASACRRASNVFSSV
jgi:hypothetical protein